jgi:transcriptional regulator with XRE-family HTH domain
MKRASSQVDLIQLGLRVREARKARNLTLETLARRIGLTKGLLSKIENFRAIPSLPVLAKIAEGLNVDMSELVKGISGDRAEPYVLVRAGERAAVERDEAVGFLYQALVSRPAGDSVFESFVLTLQPDARRAMISTEGEQFLYILKGRIQFHLGKEALSLDEGDALFFDGRIPHVPKNPTRQPAVLLTVYLVKNAKIG